MFMRDPAPYLLFRGAYKILLNKASNHTVSKQNYHSPPVLSRGSSSQKCLWLVAFTASQNITTTSLVRSTVSIFCVSVALGARRILD